MSLKPDMLFEPAPSDRPGSATSPRAAGRRLSPLSYVALRSLGLYLLTLVVVVTVVFALPRAMPGDPLTALQDPDNNVYVTDPEVRSRLLAYYGLDRSLPSQYTNYLVSLTRGDLGWSISRNAPVSELVAAHLPWTLLLMGSALALASTFSFLVGVSSAWHRGKRRDRAVILTMEATRAVPEYALGSLLLIAFAVLIPVFPLAGARTPFATYASPVAAVADVARHLVLPLAALTLSLLGSKFLLVRNTVISSLGADYMVAARAKGLPDRVLKYHHAGRNALLPFVTVVGIQAGFAVGGAVFVESVFVYPGMGTLILGAVEARDYPVLEATFLVLALVVLALNLGLELLYARLDPRVGAQ